LEFPAPPENPANYFVKYQFEGAIWVFTRVIARENRVFRACFGGFLHLKSEVVVKNWFHQKNILTVKLNHCAMPLVFLKTTELS
jgi:hypothetical protein